MKEEKKEIKAQITETMISTDPYQAYKELFGDSVLEKPLIQIAKSGNKKIINLNNIKKITTNNNNININNNIIKKNIYNNNINHLFNNHNINNANNKNNKIQNNFENNNNKLSYFSFI